jgi:ribose transport system substrate-binding protein
VNHARLWKVVPAFAALLGLAVVAGTGCEKKDSAGGGGGSANASAQAKKVHKAPDGAQLKLAFVTNNASDFWKIAAAGVKKYEGEANVKVDVRMPPTGTVAEQNGILEDLATQGYHGIAVSVIAPDDQVQEVNRAAAKTNVITHDSDAAKSARLVYIGTNNFEAGRTLGKEIVRLLPSGGKIAVFVGTFAADNAAQRLRGIEEEIKGKNITIVAKKEDNKDPAKAQDNPNDVIVAYPDVNLLVGLWSYNGPAIASAIESSGKKGKVLAAVFDEEDGTLDGIEKGVIACTVVQKPFQFGYLSSKTLHELATKGEAALPKDELMDTGVEVIQASNVKAFRENLKALKQ